MNCNQCATPIPDDSRFCLACGADVSGEGGGRTLAVEQDPGFMALLQSELGNEYVLEREVGRGGMAIVFLGRDANLGRKIAVKVLPPELTFGKGTRVIDRFKQEARMAATLDHPHIIPIYRVAPGGKLFWYAMKYLEGESLDQTLKRERRLDAARAADIVGQVAEALDHAHKRNVVHRDVKPGNVMIDAGGWVTVTDFGIAKALDVSTFTASGSMIGTPYYMSPEQCSGKKVGPASDQYSLAVMSYQMLSGQVPFTSDSVPDIIRQQCMDPPPPLKSHRPDLPPAVTTVVGRGLAKSPEQRFACCRDFAVGLSAAIQGLDVAAAIAARPTGPPRRMSQTAMVSPVPGVLRTAKGVAKRRKALVLGGACVAVVAVAGTGILLLGSPDESPDASLGSAAVRAPERPSVAALPLSESTTTSTTRPGRTDSAGTHSAPILPRGAFLILSGVPLGATIELDGQKVGGDSIELLAGRKNIAAVTHSGFKPWVDTVEFRPGTTERRTVRLEPVPSVTVAPSSSGQGQQRRESAQPARPLTPLPGPDSQAAPRTTVVDSAFISFRIRSTAEIFINGVAVKCCAVAHHLVPPGSVNIRFVWDSAGVRKEHDVNFTVRAGADTNLRVIQLEAR